VQIRLGRSRRSQLRPSGISRHRPRECKHAQASGVSLSVGDGRGGQVIEDEAQGLRLTTEFVKLAGRRRWASRVRVRDLADEEQVRDHPRASWPPAWLCVMTCCPVGVGLPGGRRGAGGVYLRGAGLRWGHVAERLPRACAPGGGGARARDRYVQERGRGCVC
jgi:hypothetical protein